MKIASIKTTVTVLLGAITLFLAACATTLAPHYDKAIVDSLTLTNTKLMELFASTSGGATKETFEQREKVYNTLIGNLDALTIQVKARPAPNNKITEKVNRHLQQRGAQLLGNGDAPSATAIENISGTIVKMRDTDKKQGITAIEVSTFKGQVIIYLDQALTYENFLQR